MVKAQVQLHESQHRQLEELAAKRATSVAQLILEGIDRVLATAAMEAARRRHAELIDKKFTRALSDSEASELRAVERNLDAAEAFLYQPTLQRLHERIEALESDST